MEKKSVSPDLGNRMAIDFFAV